MPVGQVEQMFEYNGVAYEVVCHERGRVRAVNVFGVEYWFCPLTSVNVWENV